MKRSRTGMDAGLRVAGAMLVGCAILAALALSPPAKVAANGASTLDFALALIAFLCGTVGSALVFAGAHLLDPVRLGPRWRRFEG